MQTTRPEDTAKGLPESGTSAELVREALERILHSDSFKRSSRLSRFLRFVVETTLQGEEDSLKEYTIGVEVFDRDESFDPRFETIVRVEARRLRHQLNEYYGGEGERDRVRIELPKGGYRPVFRTVEPPSAPPVTEPADSPIDTHPEENANPSPDGGDDRAAPSPVTAPLWALVVLVGVSISFYFLAGGESDVDTESGNASTVSSTAAAGEAPTGANEGPTAIAVLPFDDMSPDSGEEYFSDGITEDIITDLSIVSGLTVIARHSAFVYKNRLVSIKQIGEELGVQYVVEGSVRRAGDRLRITAQLIDAVTETHLWAQRYDRDLEDVFLVQDDVGRRIVDALQVTLTDLEDRRLGRRGTDSIEAYDYYLRAQEQFYTFRASNVERAIDLFSRSIELDPAYVEALAWKSRALVYAYISGINDSKEDTVDTALSLARQAVEMDELSPMAHANLAWALRWDKQTDEAVGEVETAIELDPSFAEAYLWKSMILSTHTRGDESLTAVERAMRLNPHYGATYIFARGRAYFVLGELEAALQQFDRGIERNPSFLPNHVYKLFTLERLGRTEAVASAREVLRKTSPGYERSASYLYYRDELGDLTGGPVQATH